MRDGWISSVRIRRSIVDAIITRSLGIRSHRRRRLRIRGRGTPPLRTLALTLNTAAYTSDAYQALDECLKGYDLILRRAVSGNSGAMRAYLAFMGPRLAEMHRLLTQKGSIYLHCDPTASHYLKGVMDAIFGVENFRNEIVWQRTNAHNDGKQYGRVHDTILFYSKSNKTVWNPVYTAHDPEYVKKFYRHQDEKGAYRIATLNAPGIRHGESGQSWRGVRSQCRRKITGGHATQRGVARRC